MFGKIARRVGGAVVLFVVWALGRPGTPPRRPGPRQLEGELDAG